MKIPAYWSKATAEEMDAEGKKVSFACWRWSDASPADAQQSALAAARKIVERLLRGDQLGRYEYGQNPVREEVVDRVSGDNGDLIAAVTKNNYGALVLNTSRVMFIDLDFPPEPVGQTIRGLFARLLGKNNPSPNASPEDTARQKLEEFLQENSAWGMRVYRTCAGLRALVTHALFDPCAAETRALMESVGTDPLYVRLCQAQESFRARLTPKPWRCGHHANTVPWPRETEEQQSRFDKWQAAYSGRQRNYATCRFLGTLGVETIDPEVERIIEIHDHFTRCSENFELA
jgi:hypothetical protein